MPTASILWIVIYLVATLTFFSVAAVIAVVGIQDLRSLLSRSNKKDSSGRVGDSPGASSHESGKGL